MQYACSHYKQLYLKIFLTLLLKQIKFAVYIFCYKILQKYKIKAITTARFFFSVPCPVALQEPSWVVYEHAQLTHTLCACVYLVCIGGKESWSLPIF